MRGPNLHYRICTGDLGFIGTCKLASIANGLFVREAHCWAKLSLSFLDIWASTQQNLSSGFPTDLDSNQSPQLQRLARILKFCW